MVMPYHLHMPSYFLETFTEYPFIGISLPIECIIGLSLCFYGIYLYFCRKKIPSGRYFLGIWRNRDRIRLPEDGITKT